MPFGLIILWGLIFPRALRADVEDCELLESVLMTAGTLQLTVKSTNISIPLKTKLPAFILPSQVTFKSGGVGIYDGFYCQSGDQSQTRKTTAPCRQYLVYAEQQMQLFDKSLLCFRKVDEKTMSTELIVILNRVDSLHKPNPLFLVGAYNSYDFTLRYLQAVSGWAQHTLAHLIPVTDPKDLDHHWIC